MSEHNGLCDIYGCDHTKEEREEKQKRVAGDTEALWGWLEHTHIPDCPADLMTDCNDACIKLKKEAKVQLVALLSRLEKAEQGNVLMSMLEMRVDRAEKRAEGYKSILADVQKAFRDNGLIYAWQEVEFSIQQHGLDPV